MRRSASLFGLLGLLFLAFGFVAVFLIRDPLRDWYVLTNLVVGLTLVLAYLAFGLEDFRSLLGRRSTRYGAGNLVYTLLFFVVVAGKWLATDPKVLLLDEPTKGVDVGAKFEIHNIIRANAARGMACLLVSSDLPEVLAIADRIVVMRQGRLRGELRGSDATEEAVMSLAAHESATP